MKQFRLYRLRFSRALLSNPFFGFHSVVRVFTTQTTVSDLEFVLKLRGIILIKPQAVNLTVRRGRKSFNQFPLGCPKKCFLIDVSSSSLKVLWDGKLSSVLREVRIRNLLDFQGQEQELKTFFTPL